MSKDFHIGSYSIIKKLGSGNFGNAYICHNATLGSGTYVLKQINLDALNEHDTQCAIQEAELLKKLSCPCIVEYIDSFVENSKLSIVMEYCDGGDLASLIEIKKKMQQLFHENEIKNVLCQITIALLHCHQQNIMHRDIKPQNIFICKNGRVKLGDFGISRQLQDSNSMAQTQIGTPYYLSPEMCKGQSYNSKSDIWALGCVVYEMINLHLPFQATGIVPLVLSITNGKFEPLSPKYSAQLRDAANRMLSKNPSFRPSSTDILEAAFMKQTTINLSPLMRSIKRSEKQTRFGDIEDNLGAELERLESEHLKQIAEIFQ